MHNRHLIIVGALFLAACDASTPVGVMEPRLDLLSPGTSGLVTTGGTEITIIVDDFTQRWSFNAKRRDDGTVTGQFEFTGRIFGTPVRAHGDVLCLSVEGNRARLGGVITHSNFVDPGTEAMWNVEDNGEGATEADRASVLKTGLTGEAKAFCLTPETYLDARPVVTGNVQVHD